MDLLVFREEEFRRFAPVWGVFPAMLDETAWVPIHLQWLHTSSGLCSYTGPRRGVTFAQVSHLKMVPFFLPSVEVGMGWAIGRGRGVGALVSSAESSRRTETGCCWRDERMEAVGGEAGVAIVTALLMGFLSYDRR